MPRYGRTPDRERRAEAAGLRSQGLTYTEIGRRMGGLSRQAVWYLLTRVPQLASAEIRCKNCGELVTSGRWKRRTHGDVMCAACLAASPDAPFGLRLRSLRLAAGLTRRALASAARLSG